MTGPGEPVYSAISSCPATSPSRSTQAPAGAGFAADELRGFGRVRAVEVAGVPFDFLADSIGHVAEMVRFGEPAGVLEVARGWCSSLAGVDPIGHLAD